ncbi:hypothetical protein ISCGN_011868 [Ixodes scapularis]
MPTDHFFTHLSSRELKIPKCFSLHECPANTRECAPSLVLCTRVMRIELKIPNLPHSVRAHRALLYTHKAWQFDDGAIECPVADLEREDLAEQSIKEPFLGEPRRGPETHLFARECVLASRRSGAPVTWLSSHPLCAAPPFPFRRPLLVAICQALSVKETMVYRVRTSVPSISALWLHKSIVMLHAAILAAAQQHI